MFYRRDGDLHPVFRFHDGTEWREDPNPAFARFAGKGINAAKAFAAAYDEETTDHPALFIATHDGRLFYVEATGTPKEWKCSESLLDLRIGVAGSLVSTYDQRYKKPAAFFRGRDGVLNYVYWVKDRSAFTCYSFTGQPAVGGAIAAAWDLFDAGLGDREGHVAVSYIRGDGAIQHLRVRNGGWMHDVIEIDAADRNAGAHAHPEMLASVYSTTYAGVVVFWGLVRYTRKPVKEDPQLYYWEQQTAELRFTYVSFFEPPSPTYVLIDGRSLSESGREAAPKGDAFADGPIGVASHPRLAVHFPAPGPDGLPMRVVYRRDSVNIFRRREYPQEQVAGPVAVANAGDGRSSIVGFRQRDRQCYLNNGAEE
jgi:hypothetical protein